MMALMIVVGTSLLARVVMVMSWEVIKIPELTLIAGNPYFVCCWLGLIIGVLLDN